MNQYAQEMGMSHTKWHNPNGAMISVLQGYYNPQRYDVNANNEITARDMSILAYHIVNDLPEMLEYTKQAHTTIMEGTPTSKAMITTILPSKVESSPLKEQMDSKLDPARLLTTTTPRQPSGKQRIIEVILGLETTMSRSPKVTAIKSGIPWLRKCSQTTSIKNPFCRRSYHRREDNSLEARLLCDR